MTDKTARHYRDDRAPPSTRKKSHVPRTYRTRPDPVGSRAESATATGVTQAQMGFRSDAVRDVDDVRRLLHPEAFD